MPILCHFMQAQCSCVPAEHKGWPRAVQREPMNPSGFVQAKPGCGLELPKELLWPTALAEHLNVFLLHSAFICPMFLVFETHTAGNIFTVSD